MLIKLNERIERFLHWFLHKQCPECVLTLVIKYKISSLLKKSFGLSYKSNNYDSTDRIINSVCSIHSSPLFFFLDVDIGKNDTINVPSS